MKCGLPEVRFPVKGGGAEVRFLNKLRVEEARWPLEGGVNKNAWRVEDRPIELDATEYAALKVRPTKAIPSKSNRLAWSLVEESRSWKSATSLPWSGEWRMQNPLVVS